MDFQTSPGRERERKWPRRANIHLALRGWELAGLAHLRTGFPHNSRTAELASLLKLYLVRYWRFPGNPLQRQESDLSREPSISCPLSCLHFAPALAPEVGAGIVSWSGHHLSREAISWGWGT